jgi:glycosyltransferase involved in cell wall biosynthesis
MNNQHLDEIKFTIITVCYNSEKTIERTFESILNQTYENIEYIVIDGNSTDKTVDIIKKFSKKFTDKGIDFKWLSESDNGIYDAMNKGINISSGDIIGIINSDDWYRDDIISLINKYYKKEPDTDIFYGDLLKVIDNETMLGFGYINLKNIQSLRLNHPTMFVKKQVYKELGNYDTNFKIGADRDFVFRALNNNLKFKKLDEIISYFSLEGVSNEYDSFKQLLNRIIEELHILKKNNINKIKIYKIILRKSISGFINYLISNIFGKKAYKKFLKFKFKIKK